MILNSTKTSFSEEAKTLSQVQNKERSADGGNSADEVSVSVDSGYSEANLNPLPKGNCENDDQKYISFPSSNMSPMTESSSGVGGDGEGCLTKQKSLDASLESPICRICHCGDIDNDSIYFEPSKKCSPTDTVPNSFIIPVWDMSLITPCCCSGSLRYVHHYCLQQWIRSSDNKHCELCKYHFKMTVKYKPFHKWERLEMSPGERKKLLCNLVFNLISMFCVFWSIYVLIERATLEARYGLLDWPFWTKMLVVSIGFLGGTIFLFVQLRLYFSIFLRWRQYNRIIMIHASNPEKKPEEKLTNGTKTKTSLTLSNK